MNICIDAKDRVTLYIHQAITKTTEMRDCTGEDGSIADRRFKYGNLEIIIFERDEPCLNSDGITNSGSMI